MKHPAVVNTLGRDCPFINPYFLGERLHYYYLSYAFPAALRESGLTTQNALFGYQAVQAYLFVLLCFFFFRLLTEKKGQPFLMTFMLIFSVSIEGLYYIGRHFSRFLENLLSFLSLVHFDGVSMCFSPASFGHAAPRHLFTPMHLEALTFLMLSLMFIKQSRFPFASAAMAFSFLSSFFIGGVRFLILGIYLVLTLPSGRFSCSSLISLASSATLPLVFVKVTAMLDSVSSIVSFVLPQASKLLWIIGLNFGPVVILALSPTHSSGKGAETSLRPRCLFR
jgi:hypothetical protein